MTGLSEVTQLANKSFESKPPDNQLGHFPESSSPETSSSPSPFSGSHLSKMLFRKMFGSHHIALQKLAVALVLRGSFGDWVTVDQGSVEVHGSALSETGERQALH